MDCTAFPHREPRSFGHQLWIDIQHATCPVRLQPAPATDVQDQFLVANREVVQDRLLRSVVALVEVQVKRRHLIYRPYKYLYPEICKCACKMLYLQKWLYAALYLVLRAKLP